MEGDLEHGGIVDFGELEEQRVVGKAKRPVGVLPGGMGRVRSPFAVADPADRAEKVVIGKVAQGAHRLGQRRACCNGR